MNNNKTGMIWDHHHQDLALSGAEQAADKHAGYGVEFP